MVCPVCKSKIERQIKHYKSKEFDIIIYDCKTCSYIATQEVKNEN